MQWGLVKSSVVGSISYFVTNWVLSTNHRSIAVMYFLFIVATAASGLSLATAIRVELAHPSSVIFSGNAEKYLTTISLHGIVMVFFVVIPSLFGAFGNFLLPTQLGVSDVAFPSLNSFMFWVTPTGFVLLMHVLLFDSPPFAFPLSADKGPLSAGGGEVCSHSSSLSSGSLSSGLSYWSSVSESISYGGGATSNSATLGGSHPLSVLAGNVAKASSWPAQGLIPGWAFITPYTSSLHLAALGKVDVALVVVFMAGLGSVFSSVNYVVTYRCVGSPAGRGSRELSSFFVDSLLVGSRMMIAANPALLVAILFLLSDSHCGTSVFDFSGGGDAVLFQHLFWFFGHPEVYIIIIPCFGFVNSLLPHYLSKRLSGRLSLQYSMYTIGFMGFAVWGHHMYMVGLANTTSTLYSTMTVMISVPASTNVLHWCVTMVNSAPSPDVGFFFILAFTYFFVLGGLSGMFVAHMGFDVLFHDTFYVIGHFHVMLAGAASSCIFAALYFYFGSIVGVAYSSVFAHLHFFFYFWGQILTLMPMFWLGYSGMPRSIMDYPAYYGGWHAFASAGHLLSVMGFAFFVAGVVDAMWEGKPSSSVGVPSLGTRFAFYAHSASTSTSSSAALSACSADSVAQHVGFVSLA